MARALPATVPVRCSLATGVSVPIPSLLLVASQANPVVSEVIEADVSKKASCPAVPDPLIPPDPTVQITTLFDPSTHKALPLPAESPERTKVESASVVKVMSFVEAGATERVVKAPVPAVVAPM
ncbi:hypothetical protein KKB40_06520, partial [Patescibacteria group bacterium]|nr:hypothetical protein [Patescibacteria group bacterium]